MLNMHGDKMYNTLIVDDEQLMQNYLTNNINAICPFFQITGIASDGLEAVELLKRQQFDLVITDIHMPEMDGLSLTKFIFETMPAVKVVIISGYDEFEYARTAIKYQVFDYLLKPLKDKQLKDILDKVKEELEKPKKYIDSAKALLCQNMDDDVLKNTLLSAIIDEEETLIYSAFQEITKRDKFLTKGYSGIILLTIDELKQFLLKKSTVMVSSYHLKLNQLCHSYCRTNQLSLSSVKNGNTFILVNGDTIEALNRTVFSTYQDIAVLCAKNNLPDIICTCGEIVTDMMDLSVSAKNAYSALALTLKNFKSPIFSEYLESQKIFINELNSICYTIYSDFISFSFDQLYSDINLYCDLFQQNLSYAALLRYGSYIIHYISFRLSIKSNYIKAAFKELIVGIDHIIATDTLNQKTTHTLFLNVIKSLVSDDKILLIPETTQIVETAKQYILAHYDESISLTMIADQIGVNASYLSDLIHKGLGEPYSKYIMRIRMEQAARILKHTPNEKIYKVAKKTGFVSPKHFISVFKKYYGVTPAKYIESLKNNEQRV